MMSRRRSDWKFVWMLWILVVVVVEVEDCVVVVVVVCSGVVDADVFGCRCCCTWKEPKEPNKQIDCPRCDHLVDRDDRDHFADRDDRLEEHGADDVALLVGWRNSSAN